MTRHLISIADLDRAALLALLDRAQRYVARPGEPVVRIPLRHV